MDKRIEITLSVHKALELLGLLHYIAEKQRWTTGLVKDIDQQIKRQVQETD